VDPAKAGALWCGTIPGGLFKSSDRGGSWQLVDSLWNDPQRKNWLGGGADLPGIHSVCVHPRDPKQVLVGVSTGGIWRTTDAGASWQVCSHGMRQDHVPPEHTNNPVTQDVHRVVQCPADPDRVWVQHHNGIFRSKNDVSSYREVTAKAPSRFGFPVVVHPEDPDTAWFVPAVKDECRVPVDGRMFVMRTRDGGKTFEVLRTGLPQKDCYDLVYRHCLDISQDGKRLAMGSTTGGLWISENGGRSWQTVAARLPPVYVVRFGVK
ncbi:MAG TPA: exo-alpha-sialidase, partial [Planctomycetota bacterium]|nr:exo-alpha-sialidase [Planctomycetota bacterium]